MAHYPRFLQGIFPQVVSDWVPDTKKTGGLGRLGRQKAQKHVALMVLAAVEHREHTQNRDVIVHVKIEGTVALIGDIGDVRSFEVADAT